VITEELVSVDGVELSGLMATPPFPPKALLMAVHGAGMTSGYFNAEGRSLLEQGAAAGFVVWAPDRPGYGASAELADDRLGLFAQADLLHRGLAELGPIGAGCFVLAHSYGLKVALAMAADKRAQGWLGLDGSGTGVRYTFEPGETQPPSVPGDRSPTWGPPDLYPASIFAGVPRARVPRRQSAEAADWPAEFATFAPRITIPVRLTFADHERLWALTDEHFDELRARLSGSPRVEIRIQHRAGHNLSLGHRALAYHRGALDFALECLAARVDGRRPPTGTSRPPAGPVAPDVGDEGAARTTGLT
jgi:hypothetical protein